ncbi:SIR2 family protein [Catonella morbi]|uniref:SIR2 family protein n=1 Tax=Catonella morbi TaxID=43997 RepID=UPI0002E560B8|nr:SIR2 family protein [Catonella morbi]
MPLGDSINEQLIEMFSLDKSRNLILSKTCQKIKKDNEDGLNRVLKDKYTVNKYNPNYCYITDLPIKNIITINIDDLLEKVYADKSSRTSLNDTKIYGSIEVNDAVNLYKLHGSVTYPIEYKMSFTEKELTDLFLREKNYLKLFRLRYLPHQLFFGVLVCRIIILLT